MGLLRLGVPLVWDEAKQQADHVRFHGIQQFLNIWRRLKDRQGDGLLWGDEIEYMVVSLQEQERNACLSLRQSEILVQLEQECAEARQAVADSGPVVPTFHPEFGKYMLESTPGAPYGATLKDLLAVEDNMIWRRQLIKQKLKSNEKPITFTSFPRLGVTDTPFLDPHCEARGQASQSLFLPDELINPHVRFRTLAAHIRERRGSKVAINVPILKDKNTPQPFLDPRIPWDRDLFPGDSEAKNGAALPDHIYMDGMGFGMGCSCLQITFQASGLDEARRVYDALVPIGPIMLALSAASPFFRGYIADVDCRWNVIAGSVDDRTPEERGLKPLKPGQRPLAKSRYDSVDSYLSLDLANRPEYNDNALPVDEGLCDTMIEQGVDKLLAKHIAHLFVRDPLVVFTDTIDQNDEEDTDHFENLQSTNWQTLRFKPPPPNTKMGWRVEFRTMEVQLTDFENAAFSVFVVLLSRAILSFNVNFYIPISKVDQNMKRAQERDAARQQKFFFRKKIFSKRSRFAQHFQNGFTPGNGHSSESRTQSRSQSRNGYSAQSSRAESPTEEPADGPVGDEYEEMSLDEIINGNKATSFPGLLSLVRAYMSSMNVDWSTKCELERYLRVIEGRANGKLMTAATWQRHFAYAHPEYKGDSVMTAGMTYDLVKVVDEIEKGSRSATELLGQEYKPPSECKLPVP